MSEETPKPRKITPFRANERVDELIVTLNKAVGEQHQTEIPASMHLYCAAGGDFIVLNAIPEESVTQ